MSTEGKNTVVTGLKIFLKFLVAVLVSMGVFIAVYTATVIAHTPPINAGDIYSLLSESSILYDDEGNEITTYSIDGGNRINLSYDEIPKDLVNAVVAVEDKTFWEHNGFNVIRIFGAVKESLTSGDEISGTSTITQQLARNVYLAETKSVRSLNRKISEAWYTVILERNLSKEQIMEAYLNAIYFGNNSYGIESAAETYFNKKAKDLSIAECAALAAIPKSPDSYALITNLSNEELAGNSIPINEENVLVRNQDYTILYNGEASKERRELTLQLMEEQGYITQAQKEEALNTDLLSLINLGGGAITSSTSYFSDYVVDEVISDLQKEGYSEEDARTLLYTGGLKIYTTLNQQAQKAIEDGFSDPNNFPGVNISATNFDASGNIVSPEGILLLYDYTTYLPNEIFTFEPGSLEKQKDGSILLKQGYRLNFYKTMVNGKTDYSVEFKNMYVLEDGVFYSIKGGNLLIPQEYKSVNDDGDLIIDASFMEDYPNFFTVKDDVYSVGPSSYSLKQKVRQPQAAMVICDNETGAIKAMVGGREVTGEMLYNRAVAPRQVGSSMKPLGVYSPALQMGADAAAAGTPMTFQELDKNQKTEGYGSFWTAASKINDRELIYNGKVWPKNVYSGYKGIMTMRKAVEISCNVAAVRVFQQVGPEYSADMVERFGITTLVREGETNDMNASALSLGGLTNGISPLEMTSAYTTFPNLGIHRSYYGVSEVKNSKDETILKAESEETRVMDSGVAFIMSDMMRTAVANQGYSSPATGNQVTAGKTGTTSNNYDAWFCGYTPQYTAALWIGNDVNLELTEGSYASTRLWGKIMYYATEGLTGYLPGPPSNVIKKNGEYFVIGTEVGVSDLKEVEEVEVEICKDSGYIASPWCEDRDKVIMEEDDEHAKYYCPIHNEDPDKYPVAPGQEKNLPVVLPEEEDNPDDDENSGDDGNGDDPNGDDPGEDPETPGGP